MVLADVCGAERHAAARSEIGGDTSDGSKRSSRRRAGTTGSRRCGEDYTAEAVESDLAVVVIVTRHPHFAPLGEACTAIGARRTATATLATPLSSRAVLDLQEGPPCRLRSPLKWAPALSSRLLGQR